jgi:threonine dehydrogenase-like Zn-dependent dehydrogenase
VATVRLRSARHFRIGMAMNKNLAPKTGKCNHRTYMAMLLDLIQTGTIHPERLLTQAEPPTNALDSCPSFDHREEGWLKVALEPGM